ncbi:MAG: phytanoyl-CoA dioxygenase family protein [Alphaproteobacteria bacterium]|nr:phytanoyl-CoA dioxygenase family protein [Alphaproteobacteria bacterium]
MLSLARQSLLMPFWAAQVFSQDKFFARNPVLGNRWLNERGLHTRRVTWSFQMAERRRRRLAKLIPADDRAAFDRDGFIVKRDFLPHDIFLALVDQVRSLRAPAREMVEGDTITRHIALEPAVLQRVPAARQVVQSPAFRNLITYGGSSAAAPMVYIQTVISGAVPGLADPQTELHTDTFHPTVKAWLFLEDVAADAMPFVYVRGSHRLTPRRLEWEYRMSLRASRQPKQPHAQQEHRLVRAISTDEVNELGLPAPEAIAVPANTLVVADTFGFHARGPSRLPASRVEIWAMGRRNPFLPWTGLDPWTIAALGLRKPVFYWKSLDALEQLGLGRQRWRDRGVLSAFDPAL